MTGTGLVSSEFFEDGPHADAEPEAPEPTCKELAQNAIDSGIRRIDIVAWRDLDDPEAGGSELHSHEIASRWAEAGLEVTFRTSAVPGMPEQIERCGYRVVRRHGRYAVFPAVAYAGLQSASPSDALVEVWNGMPFFSPLWFRGPRMVFLHHVHAEMWRMVLPGWLASIGASIESVAAPPLYRNSAIVTLSESSKKEIVSMLRVPASNVTVVAPGVDAGFHVGGTRSDEPLVLAVGRLVPVKRFDILIEALALVKREIPQLRAVIIGEGYERNRLESLSRKLGASSWLSLPGRVEQKDMRSWYQRAWVVASTSLREGWGMTLTEAAACKTPAVATRIAGHLDAVVDGETGLLADGTHEFAAATAKLLKDDALRKRLGRDAHRRVRALTWDQTARSTLAVLIEQRARRERAWRRIRSAS